MIHQKLFDFIKQSPSVFHAVKSVSNILDKNNFTELKENENWQLKPGKYYVKRNSSSIIAFVIPSQHFKGFLITASHSDSPCFKLKENPETVSEGYTQLNIEKYGGMIISPWFDRPLSIAGRVIINKNSKLEEKLINFDQDLVMIPNLAIHLNRDSNKNSEVSVQNEMFPVISLSKDFSLNNYISQKFDIEKESILSSDLFLYNRTEPSIWGANQEFIASPKLDDLECVFTTLEGFIAADNSQKTIVHAVFDNEEVGSLTRQGANSTFLYDTLRRINYCLNRTDEDYFTNIADSFMISADNAHAAHPNYKGKYDSQNRPVLNGGPVIKFNAAQKYTSDGVTSSKFKLICKKEGIPYQIYTNHSDIPGGSTLGNISNSHVSLPCVDIGIAQWAMHSPYESAGSKDIDYMISAIKGFYNSKE